LKEKVLHKKQRELWKLLQLHKEDLKKRGFLLFGGTALALQIGHRRSVDFDFLTPQKIGEKELRKWILSLFPEAQIVQEEKDTISIEWKGVQVSFFSGINWPLLSKTRQIDGICVMSKRDIAAKKMRVLLDRTSMKDYFDLAWLFHYEGLSVSQLLKDFYKKYGKAAKQFQDGLLLRYLTDLEGVDNIPLVIVKRTNQWRAKRSLREAIEEKIKKAVDEYTLGKKK
jgi:predicted nucleotidyltransferase component of viral defense system